MSDNRLALVVAVDWYDDLALRRLAAPAADAKALAEVLGNPDLGGFRVEVLSNPTSGTTLKHVDELFADRRPSDLVLLHFSCHGLKDDSGELYLAATDTAPGRLASTAIAAVWINRLMQRSRAQCIVLLLDCCYGGAFERGVISRATGDVDVGDQFHQDQLGEGRGRAVITASTAMEYAFEGSQLADGRPNEPSVFTGALVEGIRTGDADRDHDGYISLDELYDYVYDRVRVHSRNQTPCKWEFGFRGGLYIARSPYRRIKPAPLPEELLDLIEHPTTAARLDAIEKLASLATGTDLGRAVAARLALTRLGRDDSYLVSTAAAEALARTAVRLAKCTVDFGRSPHGTSLTTEVSVKGCPLACTSTVTTSTNSLRARLDADTLRITWTPKEPGRLEAMVTLTGPAGEAQLQVTAVIVDDDGCGAPLKRVRGTATHPSTALQTTAANRLVSYCTRALDLARALLHRTLASRDLFIRQPTNRDNQHQDTDPTPIAPSSTIGRRPSRALVAISVVLVIVLSIVGFLLLRVPASTGPRTPHLVKSIPVATTPSSLALTPDGRHAYVSHLSGVLLVIDTANNTVTATIDVGAGALGVAVTPDGRHVYVTHISSATISVIDTANNTVTATANVGKAQWDVKITPDGRSAYVTNRGSGTVSVINTATNTVTATIEVGGDPTDNPVGVALTPDGHQAYVTNRGSNTVSVINTSTNTVTGTIDVQSGPNAVAVAPDGRYAYITNEGSATVSVIETTTNAVTTTINVGNTPITVAVAPDSRRAYVVNRGYRALSIINTATNTVTVTVDLGGDPGAVAVTPDGRQVYVTNSGSGTVSVIDTGT